MYDSEPSPSGVYRFTFTGRTGEYFRIWVVSLFLSIVTLGIYSAWGKVRKKRYLYARTLLEDTGFEYRASPIAILKGRVVALGLFGGFALAAHFVFWVQLVLGALLIVLAAALPATLMRAQYSQAFETDADLAAFDELKRRGISPRVFASFLRRMQQKEGAAAKAGEEGVLRYLSSHPATEERIRRAESAR